MKASATYPSVVLFFTRGMSLKQWGKLGILSRELALYKRLLPKLGSLTFVTYGGEDEKKYEDFVDGIRLLYNPGMPEDEYAYKILDVHAGELEGSDIYQSNQIAGSSLVVEAARRFGGTSLVRCGYFGTEFTGNALGYDSQEYQEILGEERFALTEADHVILTTDAAKRFAVAAYGLDPQNVTLIPNYVSTDIFIPDAAVEKVPGRILFPGRLCPQKNPMALIEAVKGLDCELVFASDGELREDIEAAAAKMKVKVEILGYTPHAELPDLMRSAELIALPSHYEGGPPKMVMESMACGCTVVLAQTPGNDQLIVDGYNGVQCSTDVVSIRKAIESVLSNKQLQKRLGEGARDYIDSMHSLNGVCDVYLTLYRGLIKQRKEPASVADTISVGKSWQDQSRFFADKAIECARQHTPDEALRLLFELQRLLYYEQGTQSILYDGGVHTKHRHIIYHTYFVNHIREGEKILDVGCGNGTVAMHMANAGAYVIGMDLNEETLKVAQERHAHKRARFLYGDVLHDLPEEHFDTIVLSNILEHIEKRVEFLKMLIKRYSPDRFLMRVPRYDRDWRVPLMHEMGVDYFLDPTHYIEYTPETFEAELAAAGLKMASYEMRWNEIWTEVVYSDEA